MTIYYNGTLYADGPFPDEAIRMMRDVLELRESDDEIFVGNQRGVGVIDFTDCAYKWLDDTIEDLIPALLPFGVHLHGDLVYSGDCDGGVVVRNDSLENYGLDEFMIVTAGDDVLIHELTSRGYCVTKGGVQV